jgi:hypothetical protein
VFGGLGWAMNRDEVKAKVLQYLTEVIEKPRQEFGGRSAQFYSKDDILRQHERRVSKIFKS